MKVFPILVSLLFLAAAGCGTVEKTSSTPGKNKFVRLFSWGASSKEEEMRRYAEAGVTDILVRNEKQFQLAVKYGMNPYWRCFTPEGPWR